MNIDSVVNGFINLLKIHPQDVILENVIKRGHLQIMKHLHFNQTLFPFRLSCSAGFLDLVRYFIQINPNLSQDDVGLSYALASNRMSVVRYLLMFNPPVSDHYLFTCFRSPREMKIILSRLPQVDLSSCLYSVSRGGLLDLVKILVRHGADPNPGLLPAVKEKQILTIKYLLHHEAKPTSEMIQEAIERGYSEILQLLFDFGGSSPNLDQLALDLISDTGMYSTLQHYPLSIPTLRVILKQGISPNTIVRAIELADRYNFRLISDLLHTYLD